MDDLSNEKIRESLIQLGYNAGPVTNSTRSVYLNKLQKMLILAGGDSEQSIATDKAVENLPVENGENVNGTAEKEAATLMSEGGQKFADMQPEDLDDEMRGEESSRIITDAYDYYRDGPSFGPQFSPNGNYYGRTVDSSRSAVPLQMLDSRKRQLRLVFILLAIAGTLAVLYLIHNATTETNREEL